ncbi:mechanosensitive ion channel family protein [uncultured Roseobacter sp.]|uniref:mechanosensitive ion channel family protein n=1 Tax=uncultured Roseobacter sp. TaxID=114847 RepID=UPI002633F48F|nr:mechanosensitive ion channel family protein [uncultured Roseobacter sp.]
MICLNLTTLRQGFLGLIVISLLTTTVVAQDTSQNADISVPEQTVALEPTASDVTIAERVESIFEATGWFINPVVRVQEGVAFLDGTVALADHRTWARDLAAKTDGVVAVVNRLEVEQKVSWSLDPARRELRNFMQQTIVAMPLVLLSLFILPLSWMLARLVSRIARWMMGSRIQSPFLKDIIARTISFPVFLLGLYLVLQIAGLTQLALSVMGGAGVLGIVIGFAFRDIAENFLASLLLSIRQPFRRGDWIRVDGQEGLVQSMNTRSTVLISGEGNHIQIPNSAVFKNTIENFSAAAKRRDTFDVGIGYDASVVQVQQIITDLLNENDMIYDDPHPMVLVDSLGASTVNVKVYYWYDFSKLSPLKLKSALLRQAKKALTEGGVSMPDEAREVIFPQGIPIKNASDGEDAAGATPVQTEAPAQLPHEPAHSSLDADLANEAEDLQQQATTRVEEGEEDLLSRGE